MVMSYRVCFWLLSFLDSSGYLIRTIVTRSTVRGVYEEPGGGNYNFRETINFCMGLMEFMQKEADENLSRRGNSKISEMQYLTSTLQYLT